MILNFYRRDKKDNSVFVLSLSSEIGDLCKFNLKQGQATSQTRES